MLLSELTAFILQYMDFSYIPWSPDCKSHEADTVAPIVAFLSNGSELKPRSALFITLIKANY